MQDVISNTANAICITQSRHYRAEADLHILSEPLRVEERGNGLRYSGDQEEDPGTDERDRKEKCFVI